MGKSNKDEAYERGVRDGLNGDLFEDAMMGLGLGDCIPGNEEEWEVYKKGYDWGASHRYDNNKRSSDKSSTEPSFSWGSEKKEEIEVSREKESYDSSPSDPYFYGSDNPRSYKVPYTKSDELVEKTIGWGCGIIFAGLLGLIGLSIAGGIRSELKEERHKKLMQENHRIEKYEPEKPDKEFQQILEGISEISFQEGPRLHSGSPLGLEQKLEKNLDYSLSPDKSIVVYSRNVKYSQGHPLSSYKIIHDGDSDFSQRDSFFDNECCRIFSRDLKTGLEEIIGIKDYNLSFLSEENDLTKELSFKDLVGPIVSPDGKKIVFASTREHDGSALCLMNDDGTNIQKLGGGASIAYGWVDNDILFLWSGWSDYSDGGLSNYENFKGGKMSLINASIDERVRLDELPKIDFLLKYVCCGKVEEYRVEDGVGGYLFNSRQGKRLWESLWSRVQYNESLMSPELQIKSGVTKWMDKQQGIVREDNSPYPFYEFNKCERIGEHNWVALTRPHFHPMASRSYVLYNFSDKKNWKVIWEGGSYNSVPIEIDFLDENEGYLATMKSIYHTLDGGNNWEVLLEINDTLFGKGIKSFSVYDKNHLRISVGTRVSYESYNSIGGEFYDSYDGGKTWSKRE